jgi:hypothetical protein
MQSRLTGGLPAKLSQGPRTGYDLSRMGAGAARGANRKKKLEAAPWSGTWPAPQATLDLDFANNRGFVRGLGQGGVMDGITFTRASNGTFVGEDGLLKGYTTAGNNLLTFPQDFDNAAWTKTQVDVSANTTDTTDPLGGNAADRLSSNTSFAQHYWRQSCAFTTGQHCLQARFKYNNWPRIYLRAFAGATNFWATFNVQTGATAGVTGAGVTSAISSLGNDWYLCTMTFTADAGSGFIEFGFAATDNYSGSVFAGAVTDYVYVWGAQLELGSTATEYFPTNINVPRFDWAGTEQVRRNLLSYTEDLTNSLWAPSSVTKSALSFRESATNTEHFLQQPLALSGNVTFSAEIKTVGRDVIRLALGSSSGTSGLVYTFSTNTFSGLGTAISNQSAQDMGDGYRKIVFSSNAGANQFRLQLTDNGTAIFLGDVTKGLDVRNLQVELGSTATDYQAIAQPTTNTPLRPTETCNGLLIEEARTNRLLWCRDATQTQWAKTDITAAKDATGIDGVANAASSLSATVNGGTCIQTITLASGSRTGSVYLKRLTGTGNVQVSLDGTTWSTVDLSADEWRRIVLSGTVTNPVVGIKLATSGDAVAMDFGQVEDGAFATSPVLTTGASATRSQDLASMSTIRYPIVNYSNFTFFGEGVINGLNLGNGLAVFTPSTGFTQLAFSNSNNISFAVFVAGNVVSNVSTNVVPGAPYQIASSVVGQSKCSISVNNLDPTGSSEDRNSAVFSAFATTQQAMADFRIGVRDAFNNLSWNGTIKRIALTSGAASYSALRAITSGPAT